MMMMTKEDVKSPNRKHVFGMTTGRKCRRQAANQGLHGKWLFVRECLDCMCVWHQLGTRTKKFTHKLVTYMLTGNSASYPQCDGKCVPAKERRTLQLGSKGRYCSFYLHINVWLAVKTRAIPECLRVW